MRRVSPSVFDSIVNVSPITSGAALSEPRAATSAVDGSSPKRTATRATRNRTMRLPPEIDGTDNSRHAVKTDSPSPDRDASGPLRREWLVLLAVFLAGIVIVLSRKPDVLYNPQFYIEDGREWYSQAHDLGPLRAMLIQH